MSNLFHTEMHGDVAVIKFDDGKANVLSLAASQELLGQLDILEDEAKALVLAGREGFFSAGFDLKVMQGGDSDATRKMIASGVDLFLRLYTYGLPVVSACTGHALAAGAILLMCSDVRIGASGSFKIGLNEVAAGMPVPAFLAEIASDRLSRRHYSHATMLARLYSPTEAVDAGFLDEVASDREATVEAAINQATTLAETLYQKPFRITRETVRGAAAERIRGSLGDDITSLMNHPLD